MCAIFVCAISHPPPLALRGKLGHTDSREDPDNEFEYVSAPKNLRGVARAQKGFLGERRWVCKGKDDISEFSIDREACASSMRLMVWGTLAATAAYLSEKNIPFSSHEYRKISCQYHFDSVDIDAVFSVSSHSRRDGND